MADALLSALLSVVMKKATDHVLQRFGVMWGIQEKLEKLERSLLAIQSILGDAEERQVKEPAVKRWLASLKDAAYEADDILDEFNVEAMRRTAEIQVDMMKKIWQTNTKFSFRINKEYSWYKKFLVDHVHIELLAVLNPVSEETTYHAPGLQ